MYAKIFKEYFPPAPAGFKRVSFQVKRVGNYTALFEISIFKDEPDNFNYSLLVLDAANNIIFEAVNSGFSYSQVINKFEKLNLNPESIFYLFNKSDYDILYRTEKYYNELF